MPTQVTEAFHESVGRAGPLAGVAVTTAAATIGLPQGTHWISLTGRNFSTAVVIGIKLSPWLTILKTQDAGVTFTDYSEAAQDDDQDTIVDLSSQDTLANGDAIYVGSHTPFRGVQIDVNAANGNASVLTVSYWRALTGGAGQGEWVDSADTDGTISTGFSMAIDGTVTWTPPTTWVRSRLNAILATNVTIPNGNAQLYWTRWVFSGALDSTTTAFSWHSLSDINPSSRDTNGSDLLDYMPIITGVPFKMAARRGPGGFGAVECITDAGTANLIVAVGQGSRDI